MKTIVKYFKRYLWSIVLALVFVLLNAFAEAELPERLAILMDEAIGKQNLSLVWSNAIIMSLLALMALVFAVLRARTISKMTARVSRDLRSAIFEKVENLSLAGYQKYNVSSLLVRTTNDVQMVQQSANFFFRTVLTAPAMIIIIFFSIARQSVRLALIILAVLPVLIVVIALIARKVMPLAKQQQVGLDRVNRVTRENLTGVRVIRAFGNDAHEVSRFGDANADYRDVSKDMMVSMSALLPAFFLAINIAIVCVMWFGSKLVAVPNSSFTHGELVKTSQFVVMLMMQIIMVSMVIVMFPRFLVSANRISEVLLEVDPVKEAETPIVPDAKNRGTLCFENVSLSFEGSEAAVLRNISFEIARGQTLAIIGGTGSGKSTLLNLIPRLMDPSELAGQTGKVIVNGVDVRTYETHALRSKIAYAPQKAQLFTGTIEENIRFGKEDATEEEIARALQISNADTFVLEKEHGLQEILAEGGANLSGGQKQRLSIARAVIREADFYIFDDTFSALDFKTERNVRGAVQKIVRERGATMIVVGQRISSIQDADKILVMDEGQIVSQGTHIELLKTSEVYQQIASSQLSEEELYHE